MKRFDQELTDLQHRLVQMAERAESMLALAVDSLDSIDDKTRENIHEQEQELDQMQMDVDQEVVRMLTVFTPVASDLRYLLTTSHIATSLERMGDQATNIINSLEMMHLKSVASPQDRLLQMGKMTREIVHDAVTAYVNKDAELAESTLGHDELIDSLNDQIMKELLNDEVVREMISGPTDIAGRLSQILIGRSLERIGDQACNVCEEVIYMVKGDDVRHGH